MLVLRQVLDLLLFLFMICLIARLVIEWIQVFARDWQPRGPLLVVAESIYTITDPPIRAVRKVVPPLRLGGVAIDLAFLIVILAVSVLRSIL